MRKNMIHSTIFRVFVPIPYGALIYLLLLMINNNLLSLSESFLSAELFFCIGLTFITFEANRLSLVTIFAKSGHSVMSNIIQILANIGITFVFIYLSLIVYFEWFLGYSSIGGFETEIKSFLTFFGITSILYTLLSISYKLLNQKNEQLIDDEQVLREQIKYELEAYQSEVNPELLFESLESAIELIDEDVDKAEDYIDQLALVYRYMLSNRNNESINIDQEIVAALNLIQLHNIRYKNLISVENNINSKDFNLIPGSLPLIVEEIIKNTLITSNRPLQIVLAMEDNYLTLSHRTNERLTTNLNEAMTFKRLQNAYSYYSDQPLIKIQAYGDSFYKIPVLIKSAA